MKLVLYSLLFLSLTNCMSFNDRELRPVTNSIIDQLPEIKLEKEFAIVIGSGLFNLINIVSLDEADVSKLDQVQLAVYTVHSQGAQIDFNSLNFEQALTAKNRHLTWETIIKVREVDEQVWVLVGMDLGRNSLEAVAVFALERDELVLINVDGDFNELLEFAMQPAGKHKGIFRGGHHMGKRPI